MLTLNMIYGEIAITREDKKRAAIYWEEVRNITASIRDASEAPRENDYHERFMIRAFPFYVPSDPDERPEFMEPELKITKKNITKTLRDIKI